ncbi:transposase [Rhizobium deserti]|uniref:Transposase n=1 Tax=Rhizobium deserti TaxID=2547961 RepID=A0A4R5UKG2_9HYPH|nr:helix-turn-helix domain-containing protein [Rhizobium deserti]TDK37273.1 transposase [Rhizobium deserti]
MPYIDYPEPPLPGPNFERAAAAAHITRLPASLPLRTVCRIVRQVIGELVCLFADRVMLRRDRRRLACHVRQISMYVCHVALQIPMQDIGEALGRDRTTVAHACHVVEDRRDDPTFDEFLSAAERMVTAVFGNSEVHVHD